MADLEFETSALWQTALGEHPKDRHATTRAALKRKFLDLREKVALLVAQIAKDIPGLTVHDVTHLDALWETASLIGGEDLAINPAEAYVPGFWGSQSLDWNCEGAPGLNIEITLAFHPCLMHDKGVISHNRAVGRGCFRRVSGPQ